MPAIMEEMDRRSQLYTVHTSPGEAILCVDACIRTCTRSSSAVWCTASAPSSPQGSSAPSTSLRSANAPCAGPSVPAFSTR